MCHFCITDPPRASSSGCAVQDVGLRPLACWEWRVRIPPVSWMSVSGCCVLSGRAHNKGPILRPGGILPSVVRVGVLWSAIVNSIPTVNSETEVEIKKEGKKEREKKEEPTCSFLRSYSFPWVQNLANDWLNYSMSIGPYPSVTVPCPPSPQGHLISSFSFVKGGAHSSCRVFCLSYCKRFWLFSHFCKILTMVIHTQ